MHYTELGYPSYSTLNVYKILVANKFKEKIYTPIKSCPFHIPGKLVLTVKPNAHYQGLEEFEEPPYQYVPVGEPRPPSPGNALQQSMLLLADGLASGALVARYEMLYRKHPEMTCDEAAKPHNVNKNRYRDISPCE